MDMDEISLAERLKYMNELKLEDLFNPILQILTDLEHPNCVIDLKYKDLEYDINFMNNKIFYFDLKTGSELLGKLIERFDYVTSSLKDPDNENLTDNEELSSELINFKKKLESIESELSSRIDFFNKQDSTKNTKIITKMSVRVLALLFRALIDIKMVELPKHKIELFKMISKVFSANESNDPSLNTLSRDFNHPDPSAIRDLKIILSNLKSIIDSY